MFHLILRRLVHPAIPALLAAMLASASSPALAAWPDRPIQMIVPFPPGTAVDLLARTLAERLGVLLSATIVVKNVPGAGGNVAVAQTASAPADGYTIVLAGDAAIVVNPGIYDRLPYDPQRDLLAISQVAITPNVLVVGNDVPVSDVPGLVNLARREPVSYASPGIGTSGHRAGELLGRSAALTLTHVPYKGSPLPDVVGGRVTFAFANVATGLPLVRDGKLKALAVSSRSRLPSAPELPTMAESGFPEFEAVAWFGLLAPAGTPAAIIERLNSETVRALAEPATREKFASLGAQPVGNSPQEFTALIATELPRWARLMREAGVRPE